MSKSPPSWPNQRVIPSIQKKGEEEWGCKGAVRALPRLFRCWRRMSGEAGEELDTPAARIRARRESRAAMPDRLKEAAADDSSDEEWIADDHEDQEEDGRV